MILLLDNYDSFTWNLYQAMAGLGAKVEVRRSDGIGVGEALALAPSAIVLGPGPGRPAQAGISLDLVRELPESVPLLGVCLGHQALVEAAGGALERDPAPVHGRSTEVFHDGAAILAGMPNPFQAGRYHSLRSRAALPAELALSAWTGDGLVMAVRHRSLPRFGVQFHPESILTPEGGRLLEAFLDLAGEPSRSTRVPAPAAARAGLARRPM